MDGRSAKKARPDLMKKAKRITKRNEQTRGGYIQLTTFDKRKKERYLAAFPKHKFVFVGTYSMLRMQVTE